MVGSVIDTVVVDVSDAVAFLTLTHFSEPSFATSVVVAASTSLSISSSDVILSSVSTSQPSESDELEESDGDAGGAATCGGTTISLVSVIVSAGFGTSFTSFVTVFSVVFCVRYQQCSMGTICSR